MPMTSPVDFISGPRTKSAPGKRDQGITASFTAKRPTSRPSSGSSPESLSDAMVSPAMMREAKLASGTPVAFDEKGTVRLARGFISITRTCSSLTAYWMLRGPRTPTARANLRVISRTRPTMASESEKGG